MSIALPAWRDDEMESHDDFACIRAWPFSFSSWHESQHDMCYDWTQPAISSSPVSFTYNIPAQPHDTTPVPFQFEPIQAKPAPAVVSYAGITIVREPVRKTFVRKWRPADHGVYSSKVEFGARPTTTSMAKYSTSPNIAVFRLNVVDASDTASHLQLSCDLLYSRYEFPLGLHTRVQPRTGESDVVVFFDVPPNKHCSPPGGYLDAKVRFQLWRDSAVVARCTAAGEYSIRSPDKKKK